jgi:hypothetical protein
MTTLVTSTIFSYHNNNETVTSKEKALIRQNHIPWGAMRLMKTGQMMNTGNYEKTML